MTPRTTTSRAELVEKAGDLLRSVGSRRTPGRVAMVAVLLSCGTRHLSVAQIEERLHADGWSVDPSGVHRATNLLTARGLLHTLVTPGPTAFGLARPLHHHLICTRCQKVIEIPLDDLEPAVSVIGQMIAAYEFQPEGDGLTIRGRCQDCPEAHSVR